jgi:hypothetical protein
MGIHCVIQRVFKRLNDTRFRVALVRNEDRTSIRKSATTSSRRLCVKLVIPIP